WSGSAPVRSTRYPVGPTRARARARRGSRTGPRSLDAPAGSRGPPSVPMCSWRLAHHPVDDLADPVDPSAQRRPFPQVGRGFAGVTDTAWRPGRDDVAGSQSGDGGDVLDQGDRVEDQVRDRGRLHLDVVDVRP